MVSIDQKVVYNGVPDYMDKAQRAVPLMVFNAARDFALNLDRYAPEKSGELSSSHYVRRLDKMNYLVDSTAEHAGWVYGGTGEYAGNGPIVPERRRCLVFYWDKIGRKTAWKGDLQGRAAFFFIRWALARGMQPFLTWPRGIAPQDYVSPAKRATEARLSDVLDKSLIEVGAR